MVKVVTGLYALSALTLGASAQHDTNAKLDKPPLVSNLDYLEEGLLDALPKTAHTKEPFKEGYIPDGCKSIATSDGMNFPLTEFEVWNIKYDDCGDPWVFCHHKNSGITIDSMADSFGRMPIQMRQWVRHVLDVPGDSGWAFEIAGDITFVKPVDNMANVVLHETGHALDLEGAYADKPLSSSDTWWNAYEKDSNVPDGYAQTTAVEDVAQNTVIAVFDSNVEGGYAGLEPNSKAISNQYQTMITEAEKAGEANSIFKPGQGGQCTHRIPSTEPVLVTKKRMTREERRALGPAPDVSLKSAKEIVTKRSGSMHSGCTLKY